MMILNRREEWRRWNTRGESNRREAKRREERRIEGKKGKERKGRERKISLTSRDPLPSLPAEVVGFAFPALDSPR